MPNAELLGKFQEMFLLRPVGLMIALTVACALAQPPSPESVSNRWVAFNQADVGIRLGLFDRGRGTPLSKQAQHQELFQGAFRIDADGKYTVRATLANGDDFAAGWGDTGAGSAASYRLYLKQLYFSARPVKGIEFQYGAIGVERGASSWVASYAGDAYITGGRIVLRRPETLFFDTVSFTKAYLGDLKAPSAFGRFHRLGQSNYQQFLVGKNVGQRIKLSADYTNQWGIKTIREAMWFDTRGSKVLSAVQVDFFQRTILRRSSGFNLGGEKAVTRRTTFSGGFAAIDRDYGDLNDNAFFHGNRAYAAVRLRVTQTLTVSALLTRAVGSSDLNPNRTHFNVALQYDLLGPLGRMGFFGGRR